MRQECRERFPSTASWRSRHASWRVRHVRAVMHAEIAKWRFPLKSVVGKTFPAYPVHAQPAILCIWQDAHSTTYESTKHESRDHTISLHTAPFSIVHTPIEGFEIIIDITYRDWRIYWKKFPCKFRFTLYNPSSVPSVTLSMLVVTYLFHSVSSEMIL